MDAVRAYTVMLIGLCGLLSVLECLLEDDSYKKYISFALGLVVVIAIISPFFRIQLRAAKIDVPNAGIEDTGEIFQKTVEELVERWDE